MEAFCFSSGLPIHQEDGAARCRASRKPSYAVGGGRSETPIALLWDGRLGAKSGGCRLGHTPGMAITASLGLGANTLRQNASI